MIYDSKSRRAVRKKRTSWVSPKTLGVCFLLFALSLLLFYPSQEHEIQNPSWMGQVMLNSLSSVHAVRNFVRDTAADLLDNFRAKAELEKARKTIAEQNRELTELRYKLRHFESYKAAENLPDTEYATVKAVVLHRDNRLTDTLIINRGSKHGLDINLPVWTNEGLVGRTYKISQHFSRIQPITDPGSAVGVWVEGTPYEGVLRGTEKNDRLVFTDQHLMGSGSELNVPEPGMRVFTSSRGLVFPENILCGTITDATTDDGLVVEPVVDIDSVKAVWVLSNTATRDEILSLMTDE